MSNELLPMDTRRQLLQALRKRYQEANKAEKSRILDPVVCRTSTAGRCKRGCAICPVQAYKTLHLTNTELKYVCCVALKQSTVKYSLNDAKPVKFFVCHSH